jgi:hypothetical protein
VSAEIIAWLRSPEGEEWSRQRNQYSSSAAPLMDRRTGPVNQADDPCGRLPLTPEEIAATEGTP